MTVSPQNYPRINDEGNKEHGCLDTPQLVEHTGTIPVYEYDAIQSNS